ncbi:hypothetical protein ACFL1R_10780 [Candidatus Latescibacterota bacterium]
MKLHIGHHVVDYCVCVFCIIVTVVAAALVIAKVIVPILIRGFALSNWFRF